MNDAVSGAMGAHEPLSAPRLAPGNVQRAGRGAGAVKDVSVFNCKKLYMQ